METLDKLAPALEYMLKALLAQQHRDGFLQGDQDATSSAYSEDTVSLTSQYVAALSSCGYRDGKYIDNALRWFLKRLNNSDFNRHSMSALEVLLLLEPSDAKLLDMDSETGIIEQLLSELLDQRVGNGHYQIEGVHDWFSTLWALKLLSKARKKGLTRPGVNNLLQKDIETVFEDDSRSGIRRSHHHQELALALRLYYELHNHSLGREQRSLLARLVDSNKDTEGLWNARKSLLEDLSTLTRYGFSRIEQDSREKWRQAFVGTTHVIENLGQFYNKFPGVEGALDRAMEGLVNIFGSAPGDLLESFQKNYDWTLIMCRMLVAGDVYARGDLQQRILTSLINQLDIQNNTWDRSGVTDALRNTFDVKYSEEPTPLTLGLSGAKVLRIRPEISIPPIRPDESARRLSISGFESVVVKYGPHEEIETEYINYRDNLPHMLQNMFATMQLTHRTAEHSFIVMQDLDDYESVEEYVRRTRARDINDDLTSVVLEHMQHFHNHGINQVIPAPAGLIRTLYLKPMWRYIETIFQVYQLPAVQQQLSERGWNEHMETEETERVMRAMVAELYTNELTLNRFDTSCMHGDLHTRNIMLNMTQPQIWLKLIDLEKFMKHGDYVMDVGQLVTNLKLLAAEMPQKEKRQPINEMATEILNTYDRYADSRHDELYPIRLALAEAIAKLRIGNGQAKSAQWMIHTRPDTAIDLLLEALERAEHAESDLEYTLDLLGANEENED